MWRSKTVGKCTVWGRDKVRKEKRTTAWTDMHDYRRLTDMFDWVYTVGRQIENPRENQTDGTELGVKSAPNKSGHMGHLLETEESSRDPDAGSGRWHPRWKWSAAKIWLVLSLRCVQSSVPGTGNFIAVFFNSGFTLLYKCHESVREHWHSSCIVVNPIDFLNSVRLSRGTDLAGRSADSAVAKDVAGTPLTRISALGAAIEGENRQI